LRRPLGEMNYDRPTATAEAVPAKPAEIANQQRPDTYTNLKVLGKGLKKILKSNLIVDNLLEETEDPAATPVFWISKWVDYTEKYGIGYQLCDNSIGVLFNDFTRIVLMADENNLQYIERDGRESYCSMKKYSADMTKKITLLRYFKNYMQEHLLKTGEKAPEEDEMTRLPYLLHWFRTRNAIVFMLNDGTVQVNFFQDHTKIVLCPLMNAVTYINERREFKTFRISLLETYGSTKELNSRLRYAVEILERLGQPKIGASLPMKT